MNEPATAHLLSVGKGVAAPFLAGNHHNQTRHVQGTWPNSYFKQHTNSCLVKESLLSENVTNHPGRCVCGLQDGADNGPTVEGTQIRPYLGLQLDHTHYTQISVVRLERKHTHTHKQNHAVTYFFTFVSACTPDASHVSAASALGGAPGLAEDFEEDTCTLGAPRPPPSSNPRANAMRGTRCP